MGHAWVWYYGLTLEMSTQQLVVLAFSVDQIFSIHLHFL